MTITLTHATTYTVAEVGTLRARITELDADLKLADATNDRLRADLREATDTLATALPDLKAMSERCTQLAGQLTAMERRYDTALIHLRAVTLAASRLLESVDIDGATSTSDDLVNAVSGALGVL